MTIVIIAGGKGTRISAVSADLPKALIPINGKPVIQHQIELAIRYGFRDFLIIVGYQGEKIMSYLQDGKNYGVRIEYYLEEYPLGTAGALPLVKGRLSDDFFVFYGDTIMDVDLAHMAEYHKIKKSDATLCLHPNDHPHDSDLVVINGDNRVKEIFCKPHPHGLVIRNLVNAAMYVFSRRLIDVIEVGLKCNIEKDVLRKSIGSGFGLYGYITAEYIKDMGTPDRYIAVCDDVKSGKVARLNRRYSRKAIFLDRDGTLNKEIGYLTHKDDVELIEGVANAVRMINKSEYLAVVVSNQPVVARNDCSLEALDEIHNRIETLLGYDNAYLNAFYFCPHHPDSGYPQERFELKIKCNCRKPEAGMFLQAAKDWNIDLSESYMVGDHQRDVQAGNKAGLKKSILIPKNQPNGLYDAIENILKEDSVLIK
jgi:mannose-1-phosphate guanylyltransferase/phosphomannomutase